jgi:ABC-type sugar transport system substrate-binding protein
MKRIYGFLAFLLVFSISCNRQASNNQKEIKIAFSLDQMTEGNAMWVKGMNVQIDEFNTSQGEYHASLTVFDAGAKVDKQISDVETIIVDEYDVLIFSCVDSVGSIPAIRAAHDANIVIIDIRNMNQPDLVDCILNAMDESVMSHKTRDWLLKKVVEDPDEKFGIGLIYGAAAQTLQLERCDFAKRLTTEMPEKFEILAENYGDWDTERAMRITEDWLQQFGNELDVIITANVGMALGISNALLAANRKGDVLVTAYDITDDTLQRIKAGTLDCTVGIDLSMMGNIMIDTALKVYTGEITEKMYVYEDILTVDRNNVDSLIK